MSVDTTIWPESGSTPIGDINPGGGEPFAVIRLLGWGGGASIQFMHGISAKDQGRYLRALAEVATRLAGEIDPQNGGEQS